MPLVERALVLCAGLLLIGSAQANVYKHVDMIRGQRRYSATQPTPERNHPDPKIGAALAQPPQVSIEPTNYKAMEILAPKNNQHTDNNSGEVNVMLMTTPRLASGDSIVITLDGREIARGRHASVSLADVPRGSHTLAASIMGADGSLRISAQPVTFHVRRPTVNRNGAQGSDSE